MFRHLAQLSPRALSGLVFVLILGSSAGTLAYFYRQAVSHHSEMIRRHVADLAHIVAASVDADRQELLQRPEQFNSPLYRELLAPLKAFHLRHPEVIYVYTMRVTADGEELVMLDTTTDDEVMAFERAEGREPVPSPLLEVYHTPPGNEAADALLRGGSSYVFDIPYSDDFGTFINARHPLFDASGRYVGYGGIHYSLATFHQRLNEVRVAGWIAFGGALLISVMLAGTAFVGRRESLAHLHGIEAAEADMRVQRDRADQANAAKGELLAIATHDLKNPLAAIAGIAGLLLRRKRKHAAPDDDRAQAEIESLESIEESANHMSDIVRGILLNEGIESGRMTLHPESVDLRRIAAEVVRFSAAAAARKKINLQLLPGDPLTLQADAQLLREACDNYVSNAVKYSPSGCTVTVSLAPDAATGGAEFAVQDQGPGLSAEDQAKLFGKFQKLTPRPTGGETSTGLGLSIVKTIVELHGGAVGCDSSPGAGARFWLRLPPVLPSPPPPTA
ncbi:sensor histidine kinase [Actomonas aquatica]|uniref:histidine kinase n=1 Tax=Actomonas aquatica TaxID=2866162 RepID=A0ABZ1C2I9_9BACT|nr:HAMP domain-containing sensor histidine kinase [Opitutus sp. WL0086]WRQ85651.1 HAMP domain-containing sensor histidine kinase [Opitutus sp. WL0086]